MVSKLISGGYVRKFEKLVANVEKIQIASAWMTESDALNALLGRKNCAVQAIIGTRGNATSPKSLMSLAKNFGWESLRIADGAKLFHPKLVLFHYRDRPTVGWIGSANFTGHGMAVNVELVLQTDDDQVVAQMTTWFREQWGKLPKDTKERVAAYRRQWKEPNEYVGDRGGVGHPSASEERGADKERTGSHRHLLELKTVGKYRFQYFGEHRWAKSYAELARSVLVAFADIDPSFLANFARKDQQRVEETSATKRYLSRNRDDLGARPPAEPLMRTSTDEWWMPNHLEDYHFFQGSQPYGGIVRMACGVLGVTYAPGAAGDVNFQGTGRPHPSGFKKGGVDLVKIGTGKELSRLE